jgi:hypothetical protein
MRTFLLALVASLVVTLDLYAQTPASPPMMTVNARIVLIDRERSNRVGLRWLQVGGGRVRVEHGRGGIRISKESVDFTVSAFVDLASNEGLVESDSKLQISTVSGSTARLASGAVTLGRGIARVTGPELIVTPTLLDDGAIRVEVRASERDQVTGRSGIPTDASSVDAATVVVIRPGATATLANVSTSTRTRDTGILQWESVTRRVDALVELRVDLRP